MEGVEDCLSQMGRETSRDIGFLIVISFYFFKNRNHSRTVSLSTRFRRNSIVYNEAQMSENKISREIIRFNCVVRSMQ